MENALSATFGVLVYQENLMRISRDLCGFTPGEADVLRKAVGKKDAVLMDSMRTKFIDGAHDFGGMDKTLAAAFWEDVAGFAAYSFNRSHSVAYSMIGYQAAYLKAHYRIEFYTAALSIVVDDSDKLGPLVTAARKDGMKVLPPDINIATDNFEILNDVTVMAPLSAVKNVSQTGAQAVMAARKVATTIETSTGRGKAKVTTTTVVGPGVFKSVEELSLRVPPKKLNSKAIDHLNKVGAFARIEPGQENMLHDSRKRDQIELMPGIMDQAVAAKRGIELEPEVVDAIEAITERYRAEADSPLLLGPYIGKRASFMVIQDMPTAWEEKIGFTQSKPFTEHVLPALRHNGLDRDDAIWTMLSRRPKFEGEREISPSENAQWKEYLDAEIELLKPPVILILGTAAARALMPEIKGGMADHIGKAVYKADLDATIIIGFSPGSIFHNPSRAEQLVEIFAKVASLISTE
jgi:DNA polymerase-3 subunit alpha